MFVKPNPGHGDCFAYALADASAGNYSANVVRDRAMSLIFEQPHLACVRNLTEDEVLTISVDGQYLSDAQAKIFAVALQTDIFILDAPSRLARFIERGVGLVNYFGETASRNMIFHRRGDIYNPLVVILYTPGHYEGVCWP